MKNENQFTLRLSEKQLETLRVIANAEKRTVSAVIRNLIDEKENKEKYKPEAK